MKRCNLVGCLLATGVLIASSGCGREEDAPRTSINVADTGGAPMGNMPHGNHDPKYGGVVLMNGELHFEMVAKAEGTYTVYFSDFARRELPASAVSGLTLAIKRPGFRAEPVEMQISSNGESWEGRSGSVDDKDTDIRISYTYQGKLCTSDMPFFAAGAQKAAMR